MDILITAKTRAYAAKAVQAAAHEDRNVVLALDCKRAAAEASERPFALYIVVCEGVGVQGAKLVKTLAAKGTGGVIAVAPREASPEEQKALQSAEEEGVLLLAASVSESELRLAVQAQEAANRRIKKLLKENRTLHKKIDDIRIVNRAKLILMQNMGYTETQAHKLIETRAMNERLTLAEVAMNVLKTYEV